MPTKISPFYRVLCFSLILSFASFSEQSLHFVASYSSEGMMNLLGVLVSPDGRNVYSISGDSFQGSYNTINIYSRNQLTGAISLDTTHSYVIGLNELDNCRTFTISPDGKNIYVAAHDNYSINIFTRNPQTGALTYDTIVTHPDFSYGNALAVSFDNKNFYTVSSRIDVENHLITFVRDTSTGRLTWGQSLKNNTDGISGMQRVLRCIISPDDRHVYTIGTSETGGSGIGIFSRNLSSGALTFIDSLALPGLHMVISPDGKSAYSFTMNNELHQFSRDSATGLLTLITTIQNTDPGMDGLRLPAGSAIPPDGRALLVIAARDSAISLFHRDTTDGSLTHVTTVHQTDTDVDGLEWPLSVALSPDGRFACVAASNSKKISIFSIDDLIAVSHPSTRKNSRDEENASASPLYIYKNAQGIHFVIHSRYSDDNPELSLFSVDGRLIMKLKTTPTAVTGGTSLFRTDNAVANIPDGICIAVLRTGNGFVTSNTFAVY